MTGASIMLSYAAADGRTAGVVRVAAVPQPDGSALGSALAVAYLDAAPVVLVARGDVALPEQPPALDGLELAGLTVTVAEGGGLQVTGPDVSLRATALGASAGTAEPVGGVQAVEQPVRVTGSVRGTRVEALGQRSTAVGTPDWTALHSIRTVSAWAEDRAFTLTAAREQGANHAHEATWAVVWSGNGPEAVEEPRLSTTYAGDGTQRRAGVELWVGDPEDEDALRPHRASGWAIAGSTLDLGASHLDWALMRFTFDGRPAIGRYDLLRRTPS